MTHEETKHGILHEPAFKTGDQAIVLGARQGNIGGAIAERLCRAGWMAQEDDCLRIDTSRVHHIQEYRPPMKDELAPYDACIITLGTTHMEPFSDVSYSDFHKVLWGSLELPLECARRYVQARTKLASESIVVGYNFEQPQNHSTIIFVGSYAHDHIFTHCTSYCVAKAGLDMAARSLAWELMPDFDVHIIHPHHVTGTPMTEVVLEGMQAGAHKMTREEALAYQRKDLRMGRLLEPNDIAEMVRLILEEPGLRWLSGSSLNFYGGVR